jgi:hypothetical protein
MPAWLKAAAKCRKQPKAPEQHLPSSQVAAAMSSWKRNLGSRRLRSTCQVLIKTLPLFEAIKGMKDASIVPTHPRHLATSSTTYSCYCSKSSLLN